PPGVKSKGWWGSSTCRKSSIASPFADRADLSFEVPTEPSDPEAPQRLDAFADQVAEPTASGRPSLDFLHVLLPHQPFDFTPGGQTYEAPDPPRGVDFGTWFDEGTAGLGRDRHLWQLELTDRLLLDVIESLRAAGTYDETLLVVTADHGISFLADEPIRAQSTANGPEIAWTPLLVKSPGQDQGRVEEGRVETIDVLPTMAEMLGLELPDPVDGADRGDGGGPATDPVRVLAWNTELEPDEDGFVTVD
ncbi:MAG: sulfatase-like hydrolase/transferase, partial [Actinomycetota bacterium]